VTIRLIIALLPLSLLAACAVWQKPAPPPVEQPGSREPVETDADRLLNYYAYVVNLHGNSLQQEFGRVRTAYQTQPSDLHRMQLVLLLGTPGATFRDIDLAHRLLQDWLEQPYQGYSRLYPLAMLLRGHLAELKRLEDSVTRSSAELRQASNRIATQEQQLETAQQRARALQDKLDALLQMEKFLIEREQMLQPDRP
jgi:hypothetical protein